MFSWLRKSTYSLRKSKATLRAGYALFRSKKKRLSTEEQELVLQALSELQAHIKEKSAEKASSSAKLVETLCHTHLRKTLWDRTRDVGVALAFALVIAILVRQMWFELYEIPSGSMRPTFQEKDRLLVSKTDFGINLPLTTRHLYFDRNLIQRNSIVIFTGANMDISDVDTRYFYLFPGKKQYVKRLIGKPGDTLYFYGGKIYGIDAKGNDLFAELNPPLLDALDHIPFLDFEYKISTAPSPLQGIFSPAILYQMNEPVARLSLSPQSQVVGEVLRNGEPVEPPFDYCELWGFKNFGMTRLLTKQQVKYFTDQDPTKLEEAPLYLEIRHHPSFASAKLVRDDQGRLRPTIGVYSSLFPLQEEHLKRIFHALYTARFEVTKNGRAHRFGFPSAAANRSIFLPQLSQIPKGSYEFSQGQAYAVLWQGIVKKLPSSHPLCQFDLSRLQLLYNIGMEWDTRYTPQSKNQKQHPARYAYFRNGALYLMGTKIFDKDDPALVAFVQREEHRRATTSIGHPYFPFVDAGAPPDAAFIREFGIQVPEDMYLVLGDNHAMSGDSRVFGFVPENNLRGEPDFLFWPPGSRWGAPLQPARPWVNVPRSIIWGLVALSLGGGWLYHRARLKDLGKS